MVQRKLSQHKDSESRVPKFSYDVSAANRFLESLGNIEVSTSALAVANMQQEM